MLKPRAGPRRPEPFEIAMPLRGIDESTQRGIQPPGTTPSALNVRPRPSYHDREGIGKRDGTRRAFTTQLTDIAGTGKRILGLAQYTRASAPGAVVDVSQFSRPDADLAIDVVWQSIYGSEATYWESLDEEIPDDATTGVYIAGPSYFECGMSNPTGVPLTVAMRFRVALIVDQDSGGADAVAEAEDSVTDDHGSGSGPTNSGGTTGLITGKIKLDLYETTTLRATTGEILPETVGDFVTYSYTLSAAEVASVGNWNNARLRVTHTGQSGLPETSYRVFAVTQMEIQLETEAGTSEVADGLVLACLNGKAYIGDLELDVTDPVTDTAAGTGTNGLVNSMPEIAVFDGLFYVVDGGANRIIDPVALTWEPWVASPGTLPSGATLICTYSGRLVISDGTIYYMSRRFDPLDWDYGSDDEKPAETAAVAGSNKFLSAPADTTTALMPWKDDYLAFGCASSLWVMFGDPGFGGTVINLSQSVGVLGPRAWCYDDRGVLYFMGPGGLYRVKPSPGAVPVPLAPGRMARTLERLDLVDTLVQLAYDASSRTVHIFLTAQDGVTNLRHVVFDVDRGGLWYDKFLDESTLMGPWSVCRIYGPRRPDRRILMGGNDGYIRRSDDTALGDDVLRDDVLYATGFPIDSNVQLGTFDIDKGQSEVMIQTLHCQGPGASPAPLSLPLGPVRWFWMTGGSPATVAAQGLNDAVASGQWFLDEASGQQVPSGIRSTGVAHRLIVREKSRDQSWALDRVTATWERRGKTRGEF